MGDHIADTIAIPPGETLRDVIEGSDITYEEFVKRMGYTRGYIDAVMAGYIAITPEFAKRANDILWKPGLSPTTEFWLNLESLFRQDLAVLRQLNEVKENNIVQ